MAGGDGAAWMATGNRSGFRQARRRALTERGGVSAPRTVDAPGRLRRGLGRATSRPVRPGAPVSAQPNPSLRPSLRSPSLRSPAPPCAAQPLLAQPSPSLRSPAPPCAAEPLLAQPSPPCLLARPPLRSAGSSFAGSTGPRYRVVTESSDRADGVAGCGAVGLVCLAGIAQRITPREVVPGGPRRSGSSGPLRCRE